MAQTIYIKNSAVTGVEPSSLGKGEIAINISDGNLFYGDAGGNVSQNFSFIHSGATSIGALTATSGTFRSNVNVSGFTRTSYLRLGTDEEFNGKLTFGVPGNKEYPQFVQSEANQLKLQRGNGVTLVDFNTEQHSDGPKVVVTGAIDASMDIRGATFYSDVSTGTAPITVLSTTVVPNLHVTSATSVMTNANLTGDITSVGNATSIASGVIINADVNASAAIAYSKLAALSDGNILVGNGSNVATSVNPSGDVDVTNAGVFSIASGVIVNADVKSDAAIDYSKLAALSDGNILVGNGSNVATSVNPSGDIDITNAGVFSIASGVIINADVKSDAAIVQTKLDTNVDLGGNITFGNQSDDVVTFTGPISTTRKYELPSTTVGAHSSGDVYYYGNGTTVKGSIYYINGTNWTLADADTVAASTTLLAVALGTDPDVDGMLLRGFVTLLTEVEGTEAIGSVLYLSATNTGIATITAPTGSGDVVRVLGYSLHATGNQIYFNPDGTWVQLT